MVGFMTSDGKVRQGVFDESAATHSPEDSSSEFKMINSNNVDENVAVVDSGTSSTLIAPATFKALRAAYYDEPSNSGGIKGLPTDIKFTFAVQGADGKGYRNVTLPLEQFMAPPLVDKPLTAEQKELGLPDNKTMKANVKKMCATNAKFLCTQDEQSITLMKNDMKSMGWLLGVQWVTSMVHQFDFQTGQVSIADFV